MELYTVIPGSFGTDCCFHELIDDSFYILTGQFHGFHIPIPIIPLYLGWGGERSALRMGSQTAMMYLRNHQCIIFMYRLHQLFVTLDLFVTPKPQLRGKQPCFFCYAGCFHHNQSHSMGSSGLVMLYKLLCNDSVATGSKLYCGSHGNSVFTDPFSDLNRRSCIAHISFLLTICLLYIIIWLINKRLLVMQRHVIRRHGIAKGILY